jgi:hypothetical protein
VLQTPSRGRKGKPIRVTPTNSASLTTTRKAIQPVTLRERPARRKITRREQESRRHDSPDTDHRA